MSSLCDHLAKDLNITTDSAISTLHREGAHWTLTLDHADKTMTTRTGFDAVVLAMAPVQAVRLVPASCASVRDTLHRIDGLPVWAMTIVLQTLPELPAVVHTPGDVVIERIIRDDRKPGRRERKGLSTLVVHAHTAWSAAHYDAPADDVMREMSASLGVLLQQITGVSINTDEAVHARAHRWGLAHPRTPCDAECVFDRAAGLVVCGDGFAGQGVEAAFLSGHAAAGRVLSLRVAKDTASFKERLL